MIGAVIFDMFETLITHYRTPLYFSEEMAKDAGVDVDAFREYWRSTEPLRTVGELTFDKVIENILIKNNAYNENTLNAIVAKRIETKKQCIASMHSGIIPMLDKLKSKGVKIGLISNCFSEEAAVIRESVLYPYFDAACLSYELGLKKPDPAIYHRALKMLELDADECLYIGDGGSGELQAALAVGMKPLQAMWYSFDENNDTIVRNESFPALNDPLELFDHI